MKLFEAVGGPNKAREEWLNSLDSIDWTIQSDGKVIIATKPHKTLSRIADKHLAPNGHGFGLPFKIDVAQNDLFCNNTKLDTFFNFPDVVGAGLSAEGTLVRSLEFIPSVVGQSINLWNTKIKSFHNVHHHIKQINSVGMGEGSITIPGGANSGPILGFLLIKGCKWVMSPIFVGRSECKNKRLWDAAQILDRHLKGDRDLLACQEELIDNGFEEFAEL